MAGLSKLALHLGATKLIEGSWYGPHDNASVDVVRHGLA